MNVTFLYGTETGTAEILCEELQAAMPATVQARIASLEDTDPSGLDGRGLYVFAVSTYGSGDLPAGAEAFCSLLRSQQPDLGRLRFAMFGLGDRTFGDTFNMGSAEVVRALQACGAQLVAERFAFDSASAELPEDVALPWLSRILQQELAAAH